MEWILIAVAASLVVVIGAWILRRRRGDRAAAPPRVTHTGSRATRGVEDSMTMRLPTGGNSGG